MRSAPAPACQRPKRLSPERRSLRGAIHQSGCGQFSCPVGIAHAFGAQIRLRGVGLRQRLYYQMDAVRPAGATSYTWNTGVLASLNLKPSELGLLAWVSTQVGTRTRDVYLPLGISQGQGPGANNGYHITFSERRVVRGLGDTGRSRIPWRFWLAEPARAFRRHIKAFGLPIAIIVLGCAFGWFAIRSNEQNKALLLPFPGLMMSPKDRVAMEENAKTDRLQGQKASFSATLMTHNIRVGVFALACGMTWGLGTILLLFSNGTQKAVRLLNSWILRHNSL
jgi:hypothetical protein